MQTDKTAEALKEFFNELARHPQALPAEELEKAKNYLALQLPRNFETDARAAERAGADRSSTACRPTTTRPTPTASAAVTAAEVQRAADTYIQPDKFAVVIVGDRKVIEAGVRR